MGARKHFDRHLLARTPGLSPVYQPGGLIRTEVETLDQALALIQSGQLPATARARARRADMKFNPPKGKPVTLARFSWDKPKDGPSDP